MNKIIKKNKRKMSIAFKKGNSFLTWYRGYYPNTKSSTHLIYYSGRTAIKLSIPNYEVTKIKDTL